MSDELNIRKAAKTILKNLGFIIDIDGSTYNLLSYKGHQIASFVLDGELRLYHGSETANIAEAWNQRAIMVLCTVKLADPDMSNKILTALGSISKP